MHRIYHNGYSRRMKACFTVLRIIHMMIFKISHSTSNMQIDRKIQLLLQKVKINR